MKYFCVIAFVLAFVLSVSSRADDLNPASWRNMPGTTYSHWTYDEDAPNPGQFPRVDAPETSWFVHHPDKVDPMDMEFKDIYGEDYPELNLDGIFSLQLWTNPPPVWAPEFLGRTGVLTNFEVGSWDIFNFTHDQPFKEIWLQITWWGETQIGMEPVDVPGVLEVELVDEIDLGGGWKHTTFRSLISPNPDWEAIELWGDGGPIAIDQIVIETYCVPEPATMMLLGLGGLGLLRRKRS